jgi:hypothetical protein
MKVASSFYCVLAVFAVIAMAFPTDDQGKEHGTAEDDHGWYTPIAMILKPISKDKVESKRTVIRTRVSGYGSHPYWLNGSPWQHPALPWYPYGNYFRQLQVV